MRFAFVSVCFVLLALVFYEMSGGNDFVPRSTERQAAAEVVKDQKAEAPAPRRLPAPTPIVVRDEPQPEPEVPLQADSSVTTAVAESTAPVSNASIFARPAAPVPNPDVTLVSLEESAALFAQPVGGSANTGEGVEITPSPSLAAALTSPVTAAPVAEPDVPVTEVETPQPDIRRVKGNVVNLRGGPGTSFAVLTALTQDTEVEVLDEPGNGWIQLRPLSGGPTGWMAAYLVTN